MFPCVPNDPSAPSRRLSLSTICANATHQGLHILAGSGKTSPKRVTPEILYSSSLQAQKRPSADLHVQYLSPEKTVRANHPLRAIQPMAVEAQKNMSARFDAMHAKTEAARNVTDSIDCRQLEVAF